MANDYFAFKRFTVRQPRSAMRVGTDGVLLGAWCDSAPAGGRMLDVGTGTGVIALILAQRNPSARIDAGEIDEGSCLDAEGNFAASPWAGRLTLYRRPFADFAAGCTVRYDRIVSNPPYFVASLKSPDPARTAARHAESLSYADLAKLSYEELKQTPNGAWWISSIRQKTKVPFTVKLLPVAKAILEKYRIPANRFNRLFPENPGKVFPVASLKSSDVCLKHIARQCGITKNLKFHMARHTFATTLSLMNGIPLETVSKMLGHKYTTTTQIYAKVTNQMIDNAISRIEDQIGERFQCPTLKEESDG